MRGDTLPAVEGSCKIIVNSTFKYLARVIISLQTYFYADLIVLLNTSGTDFRVAIPDSKLLANSGRTGAGDLMQV